VIDHLSELVFIAELMARQDGSSSYSCVYCLEFFTLQGGPMGQLCFLRKSICNGSLLV
jgi:hypothetical protein